jgi:hypothetical protein
MSGDNGNNENTNVISEKEKNIQKMASAIEDLLYMGAIKVKVSNLMSSMKLYNGYDIMGLMYLSLLIYMNECPQTP